ncbi:MAG: NAD(P)/FAD-dependent oxidoreductase [Muribaculaceae bacterium]|nr:NAD(P)/FAD-dependent oxidoreductase [Muribaculaceae bacterium]
MNYKQRIVVIGAGFGGLSFCKKIDKSKFDVTIVDRNNYHSFPPLFYQVASGGLEPASISFPLRREFRGKKMKGCRFNYGEVRTIDTEAKTVITEYETIPYDILIIAAGTTNNFFGIPDLQQRVCTLKSTSQAIRTRNEVLLRLERAAIEQNPDRRRRLLTFAVIGGGPTGVEIAGALGEMKRYIIKREYPTISPEEVNVILVEGSDRLLRTMSEASSEDALRDLRKLMVEVRLNKTMKSYDAEGLITFTDGETITADTVIWTAGVTAERFDFKNFMPGACPGGRLPVDEYNRVEGTDDIYAIGDISYHADEVWQKGCPQLAQVAIQQGECVAANLNNPDKSRPFSYNDKGSMATIGRNHAVVDLNKVHYSGWFAWITWMAVHLISLLGMRNKAVVLLNWIWSYFTFSSSLRLILRQSINPSSPVKN